MKAGYKFLQDEFQTQQPGSSTSDISKPLWQAIWNLNVPGKVKNLLWRACKNALPSKTNLVRRQVIPDALCEVCKTHHEDIIHALYLCPLLSDIWDCSNFIELMGCIFAENRDPYLFAMVCWALWNPRNNLRLGKNSCTLDQILQQAKMRLLEYTTHHMVAPPPSTRPVASWRPSDLSWYKINF